MEAFRLSKGIMIPAPTNFTDIPAKFVSIGAASLYAASSFLVPYQRWGITKTPALKVVLPKAGRENWVVKYRCRASGTEKYVATDRTSQRLIQRKRLAVFVSGGGSNFRALHEATKEESIHGDISVLVTDKPGCGGAEYARDNQIPVVIYSSSKSSPEGVSVSDLVATLRKFEVDFILLAGFLKLIPVELVQAYPRAILNIHPSLLPAFGGKGYYGLKVHKAVIQSGARFSGPTIHFVDEKYDTGRILAQRVVPVLADDTAEQLAARVLDKEHELYVEVVSALCENRIVWREDGVPLVCSKESPGKLY